MKFSFSIKQQLIATKKIYCIDNGITESVAFQFSKNKGSYLENTVFLHLKQQESEIYYYITSTGKEVDFLIKQDCHDLRLVQVSARMAHEKTKEREIAGLAEACKEQGLTKGLIITEYEKERLMINGIEVTILPCYKWLLCDDPLKW